MTALGVLIINADEVRQLLPMQACIEVMAETFRTLARGDAVNPLRLAMWLPDRRGLLGLMPSYLGDIDRMGVKVVSVMPGNLGTEYDQHQGVVLLFETGNGRLLAIVDASEITAIRTAAVSAVATRLLARGDAGELAILGSGVQARNHLESMRLVRRIRRVRVWSRNAENANRFAARASAQYGLAVDVMPTVQEAVSGAEIICTTTSAREPILMGDWLAPGAHVNAVGSSVAFARELDTAAVVKARLFVDRRESTVNESGDFLLPKKEGAIGDDHIQGEIGDILIGSLAGRQSPEEITVFKSLGLAVEDLASAEFIYRQALEKRIGTTVAIGETRHE